MYFVDLNDKEWQYKFTFNESLEISKFHKNFNFSTSREQICPEIRFLPLQFLIRSRMNDVSVEIPHIQIHCIS